MEVVSENKQSLQTLYVLHGQSFLLIRNKGVIFKADLETYFMCMFWAMYYTCRYILYMVYINKFQDVN